MKGYGEDENVHMSEDEHKLRLLLAFKCTGIIEGYFDDGEMQDNSEPPFIDYLRDKPQVISEKLFKRAQQKAMREWVPSYG